MSGGVVEWDCSHCFEPLHLEDLLWRTSGGDPFCKAASRDVVAEQYDAVLTKRTGQSVQAVKLHAPRSDWVHPALRHEPGEGVA